MKVKFTLLALAALSLSATSFHNNTFSYEPRNGEAVQKFVSLETRPSKNILFISNNILWNVDRYAGTITAFDSNTFVPLWSPTGIVYRVPCFIQRFNPSNSPISPCPLFGDKIEFTEICGRVYFHLSEVANVDAIFDNSHCSSSSKDYAEQIVAIDPQTQGKLMWKLNANELKSIILTPSNVRPRFVTTPLKTKDNLLNIVLLLDNQIISLKFDSTSGALVRE